MGSRGHKKEDDTGQPNATYNCIVLLSSGAVLRACGEPPLFSMAPCVASRW
jgi:hypothetical protein